MSKAFLKKMAACAGATLLFAGSVAFGQTSAATFKGVLDVENPNGSYDRVIKASGAVGSVRVSNSGHELKFSRDGFNYIDATDGASGAFVIRTGNPAVHGLTVMPSGNVGIGTGFDATAKLDVNGTIQMRPQYMSTPPVFANNGILYVNNNPSYDPQGTGSGYGLYAAYNTTHNRLTSHADPRDVNPKAVTSFGNPAVELPFSFHHKDLVLGKGAIVDMAKMVQFVEKKMQQEMGSEAGRLTFNYALPSSVTLTAEQWVEEMTVQKLKAAPWIKVHVGPGGDIPREAVEEVAEEKETMVEVRENQCTLDLDAMKLVSKPVVKRVARKVRTGNTVKRLKAGWEVREDGLYRRATVDDLSLQDFAEINKSIPQWVRERLAGKGNLTVTELKESLKAAIARVEAKPAAGEKVVAVKAVQ